MQVTQEIGTSCKKKNSMLKQEIAKEVAKELGLNAKEAHQIVTAIFELLKTHLKNGINVEICSFGKFIIRRKDKRIGRNPQTGQEAEIMSRKVITFKPSILLKEIVNNSDYSTDDEIYKD